MSRMPTPGVGLIPLLVSTVVCIFLAIRSRPKKDQFVHEHVHHRGISHHHHGHGREVAAGLTRSLSSSSLESMADDIVPHDDNDDDNKTPKTGLRHPLLVFIVDTLLATADMVVLVITWIRITDYREGAYSLGQYGWSLPWPAKVSLLPMLAAYATIPLMVNFFIHTFFATRAFFRFLVKLGLPTPPEWTPVPTNCPHCGELVHSGGPTPPLHAQAPIASHHRQPKWLSAKNGPGVAKVTGNKGGHHPSSYYRDTAPLLGGPGHGAGATPEYRESAGGEYYRDEILPTIRPVNGTPAPGPEVAQVEAGQGGNGPAAPAA
ncbi:hypothetical protein B0H63DRAFT_524768 [Podospora didyma]|uniref:Uncharacterized protein n=1 Tax=Podospora didyma TaxID=330526 RepID=A0AAE0KIX7_9PEZI|nr:hypothetical protein B0H63DRAFT_524768 [Podospora didyma]